MKFNLWKGYHSAEVLDLIQKAWTDESLLLLLPPQLENVGFLEMLKPSFPEKPIFGIFTSGTTGRKLVFYSKQNVESSLKAILSLFDIARLEQVFCYPQPFHTFGLILGYCQSFLYNRPLVPLTGPYESSHHALWFEHSIANQMTLGTPTHFKDLLSYADTHQLTPKVSYTSIIGAASVERPLWLNIQSRLKITHPSIGYGATEASPGITHLPPGQAPSEDGEIGYVLPHVKIEEHPGTGFTFSGPNVCLATYQDGRLEFPKMIFMKDCIEQQPNGRYLYKSRTDLILNRGGEKFSLEAIEQHLKSVLGIDSVCVALPDSRLGQELGVLAKADATSKATIYLVLVQNTGREINPSYVCTTDELPLNPSFKIDRTLCKHIIESSLHV